MKTLGEVINDERVARGMTIRHISDKTGVPYSALQPTLAGHREFRAPEFFAVCNFLGLDPIATFRSVA